MADPDDLVTRLRKWSNVFDKPDGKARAADAILAANLFREAADEIERLRQAQVQMPYGSDDESEAEDDSRSFFTHIRQLVSAQKEPDHRPSAHQLPGATFDGVKTLETAPLRPSGDEPGRVPSASARNRQKDAIADTLAGIRHGLEAHCVAINDRTCSEDCPCRAVPAEPEVIQRSAHRKETPEAIAAKLRPALIRRFGVNLNRAADEGFSDEVIDEILVCVMAALAKPPRLKPTADDQ